MLNNPMLFKNTVIDYRVFFKPGMRKSQKIVVVNVNE